MQMNERCLADKCVQERLLCTLSSGAHRALFRSLVGRRSILESKGLLLPYRNFLITVLTENKFNWLFSHRL